MGGTWRKVLAAMVATVLLASLALACTGTTSYETDKANKIIDTANKLLNDYNKLQEEINANWDKVDTMGVDAPGMEQRKVVLQQILKQIEEQTTVLEKMITEYEAARKLNITADMKTYFQILIDYTNKQKEANKLFKEGTANRIKLADDIIAGGDAFALATASDTAVADMNAKAQKLQSDAQTLKDKADKYYKDKNLGGSGE
jgi:outer membrane murein-binding lipoprotein Lpp